jgi:hypothetical protein
MLFLPAAMICGPGNEMNVKLALLTFKPIAHSRMFALNAQMLEMLGFCSFKSLSFHGRIPPLGDSNWIGS